MKITTWFLLTLNSYLVVNEFYVKKPKVFSWRDFRTYVRSFSHWGAFPNLRGDRLF
jgi:hypothetical protein